MPATETRLDTIAAALRAEGYSVKEWKGERLYVSRDGREFGYLTEADDGGTGSCKFITRSGTFAAIIRKALA